jgi:hypothetical protein
MIITEVSRGITHIEDLPAFQFYKIVSELESCRLTEKLDGSQILFGIDEYGFYTSRETKGGVRIYEADEYEIKFSSTYMRSVHHLLERVLPLLKKAGLNEGSQVEAEVLYGEVPNVVPYSSNFNRVVFLRTTAGDVDIGNLAEELKNLTVPVTLEVPATTDGRNIVIKEELNEWRFSQVPEINIDLRQCRRAINNKLSAMASHLKEPSGIKDFPNGVVERIPLNKRPNWCEPGDWGLYKDLIREKRDSIKEYVHRIKLEIKDILLDNVVRNRSSKFGPLLEDGGWIEGVVIKGTTGKVVKLVDKSTFGKIRESAWAVRNSLTEKAKGVDSATGFLGEMHLQMAVAIGHPELGTLQAKNYLRKNTLTEDTVDFNAVKEYWINILDIKEQQLNKKLSAYKKLITGNKNTAHVQRTLQTFAEIFEQISLYKNNTQESDSVGDLYRILVGKQMDDISCE